MSALEALDISSPAVEPQSLAQGLYERHHRRILGFCLRRLATREEAEDAVQTTFLQALRALQRGVRPVSETAWLFKIAENVCFAAHRSDGRRREREVAEPPELEDRAGRRDLVRDEQRELLRALGTISENQRRALLLREWRGLSYREISAHLGVSVGAVEALIFRARKSMAKALGESGVRGRLAGIFDLGAALNALKAALGGGATVAKIAAAAAVVSVTATLPAGDSATRSDETRARAQAPTLPRSAPAEVRSAPTTAVAPSKRGPSRRATKARTAATTGSKAREQQRAAPASPAAGPQSGATGGGTSGSGTPTPPAPTAPLQPPAVPPPPVNLPSIPSVPQLPELPQIPPVPAPSLSVDLSDAASELPQISPVLR